MTYLLFSAFFIHYYSVTSEKISSCDVYLVTKKIGVYKGERKGGVCFSVEFKHQKKKKNFSPFMLCFEYTSNYAPIHADEDESGRC